MYESRIAAGHLTVAARTGAAPALDVLAARNLGRHGFLRAGWYGEGAPQALRTLVVESPGGTPLAAIPTAPFGPGFLGLRKVPGSYWPLRSPLLAPECGTRDLAQALVHPAAACLGPVWRVGPACADDPAISRLVEAAQLARWSVLSRPAGTSWVIDLDTARAGGCPRPSAAKKLRASWRKLEALGQPRWVTVRGEAWNDSMLEAMGRIEAQSWIARTTDGSGAKFLTAKHRSVWKRVLGDPVLAQNLSAHILLLDDRPIAFTFDLDDGSVRYGIAGSYAEDMKRFDVGKLANYRSLSDAMTAGQGTLDLGAGDSGYKREMGAIPGYDLVDLLFVRHRTAARLIAPLWGEALAADARSARSLAHG